MSLQLRHPPRLDYSGLTIILSQPSRFDYHNKRLLTTPKVEEIITAGLSPHMNRYMCDIRLAKDTTPLLPNTKCLLLLGAPALSSIAKVSATLNEQRGSPLIHSELGIPIIASYSPQDAAEPTDNESEFNPLLNGTVVDRVGTPEEASEATESAISEKKHHGKTSRKNYRFWLQKDIEKSVKITLNAGLPKKQYEPNYIIYPDSSVVINSLLQTSGHNLYFDVETDTNLNITVFSFSFDDRNIYVVPCITHTYSRAYENLGVIFGALAQAIKRNTLVCHNGAGFDYLVLAHKYHIAIGSKVYDTMLAQNRIYPEAEKSLGHCISLPWLFEPYHKDEGSFAYGNQQQALQLWRYCGKDVYTMALLHEAQQNYAKNIPGLVESINSVNSYVKPYVTTTLLGIRYSKERMEKVLSRNDKMMMYYLRWLKILIGEKYLKLMRGTGKSAMPNSNKQCCFYFHTLLKYPVVGRTPDGKASLGKKSLFKLKLKFPDNPVIDIIVAYRKLAKESGSMSFNPWKE